MRAPPVAAPQPHPQVAALEEQLWEVQLVAEKKLLSMQQEAEAAVRQARLAAQHDVTGLQVGPRTWWRCCCAVAITQLMCRVRSCAGRLRLGRTLLLRDVAVVPLS